MDDLRGLLMDWLRLAHAAARKRSAIAFREAEDIRETWAWVTRGR